MGNTTTDAFWDGQGFGIQSGKYQAGFFFLAASYNALQLAAAIVAAGEDRASLELVCLDQRLTLAARREGFQVIL